MNKIVEIVRLYELGLSKRSISRNLSISRPVVSEYLQIFRKSNMTYKDLSLMKESEVLDILDSRNLSRKERYQQLSIRFPDYAVQLKRVGVTLQILWEEYTKEVSEPYSYTQFCYHYQTWKNSKEVSMHIEHKYGDKLFVDFTGKKLKIKVPKTNEEREVEVFVSVLGASQLTYVEAVYSQKKEDFIRACENSLQYLGGVVNAIVPDCLKAAVTKSDRYEPEINPELLDFARHYDTVIFPARPYKPKDKALVENAVNIVYTRIFAPLRDQTFLSLSELNEAIQKLLDKHNNLKMQRLNHSRREDFERNEKQLLKPLPAEKYMFKKFAMSTVAVNYHVYLPEDKNYYSVPYRLKGRKTTIIYTQDIVEVFYNNERVALHKRDRAQGKYSTNIDHMPPSHKSYAEWNSEMILSRASLLGVSVRELSSNILNTYKYPEQGYKVCIGIINLGKKYGGKRVNRACEIALEYKQIGYRFIKNILLNGMDAYEQENLSSNDIKHENLRGKVYYNKEEY